MFYSCLVMVLFTFPFTTYSLLFLASFHTTFGILPFLFMEVLMTYIIIILCIHYSFHASAAVIRQIVEDINHTTSVLQKVLMLRPCRIKWASLSLVMSAQNDSYFFTLSSRVHYTQWGGHRGAGGRGREWGCPGRLSSWQNLFNSQRRVVEANEGDVCDGGSGGEKKKPT